MNYPDQDASAFVAVDVSQADSSDVHSVIKKLDLDVEDQGATNVSIKTGDVATIVSRLGGLNQNRSQSSRYSRRIQPHYGNQCSHTIVKLSSSPLI